MSRRFRLITLSSLTVTAAMLPPQNEHQSLLAASSSTSSKNCSHHRLDTDVEGASEVERLAAQIELRRHLSIPVTSTAIENLEDLFHQKALEKRYDNHTNKLAREDLVAIRDGVAATVIQELWKQWLKQRLYKSLGMKTTKQYMLEVLDRAIQHVDDTQDWFYYVDFGFYHTQHVNKFPWMRNHSANAVLVVILFFFCTPILFCHILRDTNVCGTSDGIDWIQGFYFGSVTISTVGYGDVAVMPEHLPVGIIYMIASICVSILSFSAAADDAFAPFERLFHKCFSFDPEKVAEGALLSDKVRRIKLIKLGEIVVQFTILNVVGVLASRFFKGNLSNLPEHQQWTWAESIYWSVQRYALKFGRLEEMRGQTPRLTRVLSLTPIYLPVLLQ